ncbi:hypothetical protein Tco_0677255, partial [Tanacetum coccineum]
GISGRCLVMGIWHGDDDEVMRCDEGGGGRRWGWWVMAWHVGDDVGRGGRLLDWPDVAEN